MKVFFVQKLSNPQVWEFFTSMEAIHRHWGIPINTLKNALSRSQKEPSKRDVMSRAYNTNLTRYWKSQKHDIQVFKGDTISSKSKNKIITDAEIRRHSLNTGKMAMMCKGCGKSFRTIQDTHEEMKRLFNPETHACPSCGWWLCDDCMGSNCRECESKLKKEKK